MENTVKRGDKKIVVEKKKEEPSLNSLKNVMDGLEVIDEDGLFE